MNFYRCLLSALACAVVALSHSAIFAQDPSSQAAQVKVIFRAFDLNSNMSLSGSEIVGCGCGAYDANRDGQITWEEFRSGYERAPLFGGAMGAAPAPPAGAATARFKVGETVELNVDGTW